MKRVTLIMLLSVLALAACGGEETDDPLAGTPTEPTADLPLAPDGDGAGDSALTPLGATLTVPELLEADPEKGPYAVVGYVFLLEDGRVILSEAIAESYPPQPGGERVQVEGLDLNTVPFMEPPEDTALAQVQWTEVPIELIGTLVDGVFVGNTLAAT